MKIPSFVLRKLYVKGSLARDDAGGARFVLKNTLATATLTGLRALKVDGKAVPPSQVRVRVAGKDVNAADVREDNPLVFERNADAEIAMEEGPPGPRAKVRVEALSAEFGELIIEFEDDLPA